MSLARLGCTHDGVIATASQDSTIKLWNQDGNVIYTIQNESNLPYTLVEFSPDGEYLIASASNRVISIWDNKFRLLRTLGGHQSDITALAFSADVKKLASLDARGQVIVRSLPEFRHKTFHLNDSRETKAVAVRYGQSLSHLIAVSLSNVAIVLDEDGQSERRFNHGISNVHCARASTYVDKLVCCGESNKIEVFSTSGEHIHQFYRNDGDIYTCNISPDGQTIVSAGKNGEINLWKQNSFQEAKCELTRCSIQAVSYVPATDGYIVVDKRSQISIWNSWQKVRDATAISSRDYSSICIHPTEPLAAIVDLSTIHLWRYGAGETASIHSQQSTIMCTSFTQDGRFLITGDSDGLVKVWADTNKNLELQTHFYAGEHSLSAVSTAPRSKTLAVGDFAGNVVICNISGKVLSRFDAHVGRVSAVTHTPDGNFLITAGADSTIKLWSISKRTCRVFKGHNGSVEGITLGQGGSLISWGSDFTLRIWTLDGRFHRVLKDYPSESVALAHFTNDGNEIRVIGDQGDIHIINLNLNNLVSQATAWCSGTN